MTIKLNYVSAEWEPDCLCYPVGVNVSFQFPVYSVLESNLSVEVCVVLSGQLARPVALQIFTSPATALAGPLDDFISVDQNLTTECVSILINLDDVVENTEVFTVNLSSADSGVTILQSSVDVFIHDSSTVDFQFSSAQYSVFENSSRSVCAMMFGGTVRTIATSLQVSSTGRVSAHCSSSFSGFIPYCR